MRWWGIYRHKFQVNNNLIGNSQKYTWFLKWIGVVHDYIHVTVDDKTQSYVQKRGDWIDASWSWIK